MPHPRPRPAAAALLGLAALPAQLPAQPAESAPVVVTATRTPVSADEATASVTVIEREAIEASQARDLLELLRLEAGLDLARNGGPGQTTSVFLRGTNSNHVLVLIDGVRAASATTGGFAWAHLDLAQVERIEIVRGPRASLWGSDAIGGVIQIFTRRPRGPDGRLLAGSYGTRRAEAGIALGERARLGVQASVERVGGFSAQNPAGFSYDPDDDGYRNRSATLSLTVPLGADQRLDARLWRADARTEFDKGVSDSVNRTLSVTVEGPVSERWAHGLRIGAARDLLVTRGSSQIETRRTTVDWQHDLDLTAGLLTLGLSWYRDEAYNRSLAGGGMVFDRTIRNGAVFVQWQTGRGPLSADLALRTDDHSAFGRHTTGSVALGWTADPRLHAYASFGTAFRAPTLNELYHPGFSGFYAGNPDLDPERSRTAETGLRVRAGAHRLALSVHRTDVRDLIAYQGTAYQATNVKKARIEGIEAEWDAAFQAWRARLTLTLQRPRDLDTGKDLLRRPRRKGALVLERRLARGAARVELLAVGRRKDYGAELPGYALVNAAARLPLGRGLLLEVRAENLTDRDYALAYGYNTPGRSAYLSVRYRPETGGGR